MKLNKRDFYVSHDDWGCTHLALTVEGQEKLGLENKKDEERFYEYCKGVLAKYSKFPKLTTGVESS